MDSSAVTMNIGILAILISLSALFSCSETSLFSISDIKLRSMKDSGNKKYEKLITILENPDKLLTAILISNNLVNILASSFTTMIAYELVGSAGVGIATGLVTFLVLVFGEIVPKNLAIKKSEKIAIFIAPFIHILMKILTPAIFILNKITKLVLDSKDENNELSITQEELETMVDVSNENGILDDSEKEIIYNVFDFKNTQIKDIMVNRLNIIAIEINDSYENIKEIINTEKFSRYPVYDGDLDNMVGMLNSKDLLFLDNVDKFNLKDHIRECGITYEFKNINESFKEMKKDKVHMQVVFDEYGATVGLVTIEDLIEELVGEIEDEYDTLDDKEIVEVNKDEFIVSGSTSLTDINDRLKIKLQSEEIVSIGGYIIDTLGRLPKNREIIEMLDFKFHVLDVNKNTIKKIKIIKN